MNFDCVFRSCKMEGSTIVFLLRTRNWLIFKGHLGNFTQNPGRFYNNFSFKEEERAHFQGGTGPRILIVFQNAQDCDSGNDTEINSESFEFPSRFLQATFGQKELELFQFLPKREHLPSPEKGKGARYLPGFGFNSSNSSLEGSQIPFLKGKDPRFWVVLFQFLHNFCPIVPERSWIQENCPAPP